MITDEQREEIRRIQAELKQPFPAIVHQFRKIPGGSKKWVFLPWQIVRDRLDEVCPDWMPDYSEIQYLVNDAICRCGITILGIRKEAIASVPISLLSGEGNEMTRGSAADRLAAEALKNSSETWGVGRYLDDQEFTIRYLWDRMKELDDEKAGEVRRLFEQYKIQIGARPAPQSKPKESGFLSAVAIPTKPQVSPKATLSQGDDLYPANNNVVKQVRNITGHDAKWIFAQCRHYECDRPGNMTSDKLQRLVSDMLVDFAVTTKVVSDRPSAVTSVESTLTFATASGQPILEAALSWLSRYQLTSAQR